MKGQAILGIIIMAVIAIVILIFVFYKGPVVEGCKNVVNLITIEESRVSTRNPYPGSSTAIDLLIKNNGNELISGVEVNFFNIAGLDFVRLECEGTQPVHHSCFFDDIEPLDVRSIALNLKVPLETIKNPFVEYYVQYSYTGQRKADIPIIDGTTRETPMVKFSHSCPSDGPVVLDFELPAQRQIQKDSQIIYEYWGVKNQPFELKLKFSHKGTVSNVQPITIPKGKITLDLKNVLIKGRIDDTELRCDFEGDIILSSKKDVKVPEGVLICNLMNKEDFTAEISASVWSDFTYTYQFRGKETFTIREIY